MKLSKEDIQKFATEEEKKILGEDIYSHPENVFTADQDRLRKMGLLRQDIALAKKKIIAHHKRYGAHEMGVGSWADKLIGKLEDKWGMNDLVHSGYQIERKMAELLKDLWAWAINYEGEPERPKWVVKGASFGHMPWDVKKESKQLTERKGYIPLYKTQKKILDKFIETHFNKIYPGGVYFDVVNWPGLWDEVVSIRDTETLYQDINRYVSDKLSKLPRREWDENTNPLLNNEDNEALIELKRYNDRELLKESLADSIAMKHIEDSNGDLDVWEDTVRKMTPEELDETEFEFESARDGITWYIQKWTIPSPHREEKRARRKLYQTYLNRIRKVKKERELEKPDFSKAIDIDRLKNMSDEDLEKIAKMFK